MTSITLHVGAGTFLPVKTQNINDHKMHFESFEISQNTVNILKNAKLNGKNNCCWDNCNENIGSNFFKVQ